ncbi:MAG TPA: DHA2 family efflux MFS transporter permease subunit [Pseudonocardiaceae bacterium]|jgi:EmrB/QacA subfamily drug resistance transporter|nr:DHA2 family efflux MFS transporter permease subunit [Pseudonocardiaceae bacterium]
MSTTASAPGRAVNPWAALSALCIGFFMIMLDTTIVNVAVPTMLRDLHASLNEVIWVNSAYLLTYAVPLLLTGRLGDRLGRKRMFLFGMVLFTGASLWCGLSTTAIMLIIARAVQGLGAAAMTPQTMAFITNLFPPARRGAPMGAWGAVAGVATIAGPLLGGVLVDNFGWQWIFMVNVPIGVVGLVLTVLLVPGAQERRRPRFDLLGTVLSGLGLLAVVFGLQNGQQYDWGKAFGPITVPEIIGFGVLLLVAFVIWQRRNRNEPLLPLSLFGYRNFTAASAAGMTIGFAMIGMFLPLTIYFQSVLGLSPLMAGVLTAPMSLISGIVAPVAGRLSDRISGKYVALAGFLVLTAGILVAVAQARPSTDPWALIPALLVMGMGVGCVFSPLANVATGDVPLPMMGAASGVFNTARQVGGVIGSAAIGVLLQARLIVSMHAAAVTASNSLPAPYRDRFVSGMGQAANSATSFGSSGPAALPGVPSNVAGQINNLAVGVFHQGFTDAARATLLLPAGVLLLGALACVLMVRKARRPPGDSAPPAEAALRAAA